MLNAGNITSGKGALQMKDVEALLPEAQKVKLSFDIIWCCERHLVYMVVTLAVTTPLHCVLLVLCNLK